MTDEYVIYRAEDGSFFDNGSLLGCICYWDKFGAYLGQEQMNVTDDSPGAPDTFFFPASGNQAGEYGLTEEKMQNAVEVGK